MGQGHAATFIGRDGDALVLQEGDAATPPVTVENLEWLVFEDGPRVFAGADPGTPQEAADVATAQIEGSGGVTINHFLLSRPLSMAGEVQTLRVATIDGTATAGEDYVATDRDITLEAGQTTLTVAVEIIADELVEADETVSLRVWDPDDETFTPLVATHTIVDDDALLL